MKFKRIVCVGVSTILLALYVLPAFAEGYVVIVNVKNPVNSMSKSDIAKYYLREEKFWSESKAVAFPIDLAKSNVLMRRFSKDVVGLNVQKLGAYWNKAIAQGKKKPKVVKTDAEMIKKIGIFKGGIGYVDENTALNDKVKVISIE